MAVPKYYEMYNEFLKALIDGKEHEFKEIRKIVSQNMKISDMDLKETLDSGQNVFYNRIAWAKTYLKKAGLIFSPKRATFIITGAGKKLVDEGDIITDDVLRKYDSFKEFKDRNSKHNEKNRIENIEYTPQEEIDIAINKINIELENELLQEIISREPYFLEELSVKLLVVMGYGKIENTIITNKSVDEGIDGIVLEDELGIDTIYIQTKRFDIGNSVSRPELQKFVGAMVGKNAKKGVFITTSNFGKPAIEYANNQNVILIDGQKLVKLMIKYNVGCYTECKYEIKKLDLDFFENN